MRKFLTYIVVLNTVLFFSVSFGQQRGPTQEQMQRAGEIQKAIEEEGRRVGMPQPTQEQIRSAQIRIKERGYANSKAYFKGRKDGLDSYRSQYITKRFVRLNDLKQYVEGLHNYMTRLEQFLMSYLRYWDEYYPDSTNSTIETERGEIEKDLFEARIDFDNWNTILKKAYDPFRRSEEELKKRWPQGVFGRTFPSPTSPERPGSQTYPADPTKLPPGVPRDYLREKSPEPPIQYDLLRSLRGGNPR